MSEKKNLNDLSIDELKELAKTPIKVEERNVTKGLNEAHKFILAVGIQAGEGRIPSAIIYERYKIWKRDTGQEKDLLSKFIFMRLFAPFFKSARNDRYKYYFVDPAPFELSPEAMRLYEEIKNAEQEKRKRDDEKRRQEALKKIKENS
jgi:hypothetical protein